MNTTAPISAPPPDFAKGEVPDGPDSAIWRGTLVLCGSLLVFLGLATLLAWATGNLEYIQIDSTLTAMHYNAAFAFLAWGGASIALGRGRHRLARGFAFGMFGLGAVTAIGHIPGLGLDLAGWMFELPRFGPSFPPGGTPIAMSFGMTLASIGVLLISGSKRSNVSMFFATLIGATLLIGTPVAFAVVTANNTIVTLTGLSVIGVVGATIGGLGLFGSMTRWGIPSFTIGRSLPLTVGVFGIAFTFLLWTRLNSEQDRRLHRQVQSEANAVSYAVQERMSKERQALLELAERVPRKSPEERKDAIGSHVGLNPACLGIALVDTQCAVHWIETRLSTMPPTTFAELGIGESVTRAVNQKELVAARALRSCWNGARVLVIYAPHSSRPEVPGGLLGVFRLQGFFETAANANVAPGFAVVVTENDETLFTRYAVDQQYRGQLDQTLPIPLKGFDWRISVWPTRESLERESLSLPPLALLIGLLTTVLLALAVFLAQTARRRTFALEKEARERTLAESALKQSEEKYRSLIENLGQGIFLQDRNHRYVAANPQFCRSVERSEAEVVGATDGDLFDAMRASSHGTEIDTVLRQNKSIEGEEERMVDGRRVQIRRVLTPVHDAAGQTTGVLGICWDVTEQRQLEAHVHQASKMDAIGQLAGGIAHDFNNLLTVILGNLELILAARPETDPSLDFVRSAQHAATRAASLTQRLLSFSRRHQLDWAPTNLNAIVNEVVGLLRRTIDPLIRIETRFDESLWPVQADPAQLNQVLMNLCLNARDAISGAGQITLETTCLSAAEVRATAGLNGRTGEFIQLRVTDSGSGMISEVKSRIYEPFFTTKEVGKGTGLGLPMVFAIVRQHKGWIDCWSEPGRGTRFDIYLPRGDSARVPVTINTPTPSLRPGKGTILVVDDEELIRRFATAALQSRGYNVIQAADGQQAIDIYSKQADRIDVVLLDLTMPILSGHEAFRQLLSLNPRVRVVFASGYAAEQLTDLEKELMAGFIKKPYPPAALILAMEEVLQRSSGTKPSSDPPRLFDSCPQLHLPATIA